LIMLVTEPSWKILPNLLSFSIEPLPWQKEKSSMGTFLCLLQFLTVRAKITFWKFCKKVAVSYMEVVNINNNKNVKMVQIRMTFSYQHGRKHTGAFETVALFSDILGKQG
jgi:hypothetical protein